MRLVVLKKLTSEAEFFAPKSWIVDVDGIPILVVSKFYLHSLEDYSQ